MRGTLRKTKLKDWYEVVRETCPICNKSGGCMIHSDGNRVVCIRVESKIQFSKHMTSWVHYLKEPMKVKASKAVHVPTNPKAAPAQLNAVYNALIDSCRLEDSHYENLMGPSRAMKDQEIQFRQYRSFPKKPWNTVKAIQDYVDESAFEGIPGFYKNQYGWSISGAQGMLIPYRDEKNQVIGFQVRVDNPGLKTVIEGTFKDKVTAEIIEKPNLVQVKINGEVFKEAQLAKGEHIGIMTEGNYGSVSLKKGQRYFWLSSTNRNKGTGAGDPLPVHVAVPSKKLNEWEIGKVHQAESVWITEGALKADIAVEHMERLYNSGLIKDEVDSPTFIGLPGVETWFNLMGVLKKMNTKSVTLAYDMDLLTNPYVLRAVKAFMLHLKEEGYQVRMAMWNEEDGKGIDDCLLQNRFPQVKSL